ncbi:MAG: hypothetical protein H8E44_38225 [Planctomycetes bacterium]|nr:hypothetical protein [Planctomycetota bacterium]
MSSIVAVSAPEGFVVSTDRIVYKNPDGGNLRTVRGITPKMFSMPNGMLVAGTGDRNRYFPLFNDLARRGAPVDACIDAIQSYQGKEHLYGFYRTHEGVRMDSNEGGGGQTNRQGCVCFPEPLLNELFMAMYESDAAKQIRGTGLLGIASLVSAFNAFALALCSDIAGPFDVVLYLPEGSYTISGGPAVLPVSDFS